MHEENERRELNEVATTLRIPGNWDNPGHLLSRMPAGYRLTSDSLVMPDGQEIEFYAIPPDDQFARIFRTSCRNAATKDELAIIDEYTVNIGLSCQGGSMALARTMMEAGAAVLRAGGAGVFIDNSALAHGRDFWIELTEDGGSDAISFAFVSVIRGTEKFWTMGMHVLGFPDIELSYADNAGLNEEEVVIDVLRYICTGDRPIVDGDVLTDDVGEMRYKVFANVHQDDRILPGSPMFNPLGRLRLKSLQRIAENN